MYEFIWNEATQKVERFAISFEQHSEGRPPALRGFVRYRSFYGAHGLAFETTGMSRRRHSKRCCWLVQNMERSPIDANGSLIYTPELGFSGRDSFIIAPAMVIF